MWRVHLGYWLTQAVLWAIIALAVIVLIKDSSPLALPFTANQIRKLIHELLFPFLPIMLIPGIMSLGMLPSIHRFNGLLEATWRGEGDNVPLATHQPTPNASALSLPVTLRLRARWPMRVGGIALFFVALAIYALAYGLTSTPSTHQRNFIAFLLGGVVFLFIACLVFMFFLSKRDESVTFSEEGATQRNATTPTITSGQRWDECQLFAVTHGRKTHPARLVYILAAPGSAQHVAWPYLCRQPRWYSWEEPELPFPEYERQMQALLSVVSARTGLPLRDLRRTARVRSEQNRRK